MTPEQERAFKFSYVTKAMRATGWDIRFCVDGFPPEADKRTDTQKRILGRVKTICANTGAIVALCGPRGLGKTTIAAQFAVERGWEDYESWFVKVNGFTLCRYTLYRKATGIVANLKCIYGDFGSIHTVQGENYQRDIVSAEILVIDEWQEAGADGKYKDGIMTDIIDRRYAAKRDTIIITNQTEKEFRNTTNDSIISRLGEHGAIIECTWSSFREK